MQRIHLVGIGGSGMSAIAKVLWERGYSVTGSDQAETSFLAELRKLGIPITVGHKAENIQNADLVLRTSAATANNPEVKAALDAGIPVMRREEYMRILLKESFTIAVAGTHGKTTTTSMIAWTLTKLGLDPSYIIGSVAQNLKGNAHAGKGLSFVIEADEYDRMFLGIEPSVAVITSIEHDHPDCFPTEADYREAFRSFIANARPYAQLVLYADEPGTKWLRTNLPRNVIRVATYGEDMDVNFQLANLRTNELGGSSFDVLHNGNLLVSVNLKVPGKHNALNALATLAACYGMVLPMDRAALALSEFEGSARRFQVIGTVKGITTIDDYAHHPTEIRATIQAAKARYPKSQIWAVWQPHTFSRTQTLINEFEHAFQEADSVVITEVYASRETANGFSAASIVEELDHPSKHYSPNLDEVEEYLYSKVKAGDVVVVLSAGDANRICTSLLERLRNGEYDG